MAPLGWPAQSGDHVARPGMFEVRKSSIPNADLGLFAAQYLEAPIVLCYGGTVRRKASVSYEIFWKERRKYVVSIPLDSGIGWYAAMACEPVCYDGKEIEYKKLPDINRANCFFAESASGVYLILAENLGNSIWKSLLCSDSCCIAEAGKELYVHYGGKEEREYKKPHSWQDVPRETKQVLMDKLL